MSGEYHVEATSYSQGVIGQYQLTVECGFLNEAQQAHVDCQPPQVGPGGNGQVSEDNPEFFASTVALANQLALERAIQIANFSRVCCTPVDYEWESATSTFGLASISFDGGAGTLSATVHSGGRAYAQTWINNALYPCPASVAEFSIHVTKGTMDWAMVDVPGYLGWVDLQNGPNNFSLPLTLLGEPFEFVVDHAYENYNPNIPPIIISGTMSIVPAP